MATITREKIEAAISNPDPAKKCLALQSIALHIGCTRMQLWEWAQRQKLTWLIPIGQIDHGVISRYIARGSTIPSDISKSISSKNFVVPAKSVSDYMAKHGLKFPKPVGVRPTPNTRHRVVTGPDALDCTFNSLRRETIPKSNERRMREARAAA